MRLRMNWISMTNLRLVTKDCRQLLLLLELLLECIQLLTWSLHLLKQLILTLVGQLILKNNL
jgi:hypothetical protein